ncbi:hypothetical protein G7068_07625 [Leucobacter viscericola]|uniref:Uncharacterized protein n=1 Tax=Leucobacter viscericola TaxID=2714935 RepID=A0A6G7XEZ3_9MICO|nr:hypothetical protein [Leucobacter viscericola]QIK63082.1 hypothetical protein G7068_07625 [Leucobacter viscericola]
MSDKELGSIGKLFNPEKIFLSTDFITTTQFSLAVLIWTILIFTALLNKGRQQYLVRYRLRAPILALLAIMNIMTVLCIAALFIDWNNSDGESHSESVILTLVVILITITTMAAAWSIEFKNSALTGTFTQAKHLWLKSHGRYISQSINKKRRKLPLAVQNQARDVQRSVGFSRFKSSLYATISFGSLVALLSGLEDDGTNTSPGEVAAIQWEAPPAWILILLFVLTGLLFFGISYTPILGSQLIRLLRKWLKKSPGSVDKKEVTSFPTTSVVCVYMGFLPLFLFVPASTAFPSLFSTLALLTFAWVVVTTVFFYGFVLTFDPTVYDLRKTVNSSRKSELSQRPPKKRAPRTKALNFWLQFLYAEADIKWGLRSRELRRLRERFCLSQQMFEPKKSHCPISGRQFSGGQPPQTAGEATIIQRDYAPQKTSQDLQRGSLFVKFSHKSP